MNLGCAIAAVHPEATCNRCGSVGFAGPLWRCATALDHRLCEQCFKVEDRERLLAVIEAGFGDFKEFNELVRDVFKSRLEKSRLGTQELHSASGGLAAAKERYTKKEEDDAKLDCLAIDAAD